MQEKENPEIPHALLVAQGKAMGNFILASLSKDKAQTEFFDSIQKAVTKKLEKEAQS